MAQIPRDVVWDSSAGTSITGGCLVHGQKYVSSVSESIVVVILGGRCDVVCLHGALNFAATTSCHVAGG